MRTAFFLLTCSLLGCGATAPTPPSRTLDQPFAHTPTRRANTDGWRRVTLRYAGGATRPDVSIEQRYPSDIRLLDLRTSGDPRWSETTADFLVPGEASMFRFLARTDRGITCPDHLSRLSASSVGRSVDIFERRRDDGLCELVILLTPIDDGD